MDEVKTLLKNLWESKGN